MEIKNLISAQRTQTILSLKLKSSFSIFSDDCDGEVSDDIGYWFCNGHVVGGSQCQE